MTLTKVNRYILTHPEPDSDIETQYGVLFGNQVAELTSLLDDVRHQADQIKRSNKLTDSGKADEIKRLGKATHNKLKELTADRRRPIEQVLTGLKIPDRLPDGISGYLNLKENQWKNPVASTSMVSQLREYLKSG